MKHPVYWFKTRDPIFNPSITRLAYTAGHSHPLLRVKEKSKNWKIAVSVNLALESLEGKFIARSSVSYCSSWTEEEFPTSINHLSIYNAEERFI